MCRSGRVRSEVTGSEHHGGLQKRSGFWVEEAEKPSSVIKNERGLQYTPEMLFILKIKGELGGCPTEKCGSVWPLFPRR